VNRQSPEPYRPRDASQLRISDDDRHAVAEMLRHAAGEGRIDIDELQERLESTYQAKTYGELVPITADLPPVAAVTGPVGGPGPAAGAGVPRYSSSIAVMSNTKRTGVWVVEDGHSAFACMGSVLLDLREAQFDSAEVIVNASALMGEVKLVVDAGTTIVMEGHGVMGEYSEQRPRVAFDPTAGGPVVRVRGIALMGSVRVRRRGGPGQTRRRRLGRPGT
jgi:DUF1707 SHOCT-like domain